MAEEQKAYEPDTGELDIDMGDHEAADVEIETSDDSAGTEHDDVANSAQKRINRLTKKMRDAERQREEAIRYAQQVYTESEQLKQRMKQLDTGYLQEYGSRLDIETKTAEAELKRAVEIGDSDRIITSQRRLNELYAASQKYRDAKRMQDTREQQYVAQQQYAAQQQQYAAQQAPRQQEVRRPDRKAEEWAERNTWFGQDEVMTFAAFGIHKKLVEDEGFDPQSDEYYNELDRRVQRRFGNAMRDADDTAHSSGTGRRPAQTVAGVSRTSGKMSGRKKVRLTPTQVAIAKKLGVPLEEYAKYVKD
jgi:nitroreductase